MLFVCYADMDGDISDTVIEWKGNSPRTPKRVEKMRKLLAATVNENNCSHIKIINWKKLKKDNTKQVIPEPEVFTSRSKGKAGH